VLLQAIKDHAPSASGGSAEERAPSAPVAVLAYPKLAARIPTFLKNRRQDVAALREALTREDFDTVARLGHSMKGAGASFGFQAITDIGAGLEQDACSANAAAVHRWVRELSAYLDRVDGTWGGDAERVELPRKASSPDTPRIREVRRVVLVEDDEDMRVLFRVVIEESGHRVTEARDGAEGVARILADRPDVAIVDITMPGMDGYEVARRVRAAIGRLVLLVAVTGHGQETARAQALAAGFDLHMTKPVDVRELEWMLEAVEFGRAT
jgi:CheY-like chemotaxis protein